MNKKILLAALYGAAFLFLAWLIVSYVDIVSHNMTTCSYWKYNLFTLIF